MKRIIYEIELKTKQYNPETDELKDVPVIAQVVCEYNENELSKAKEIAINGKYEIIDDGVEEISIPSQLDIIEAQITYTAMMTDTLLEV